METIAARKALLEENAAALGIQYVEATAPDPTGDAGVAGAQQFILEDVPLKLKEFEGKKVAFFTTNCGMQEPLQAAILDQPNAYYPQPCCPSPYHAFPASLGLEIKAGGDDTGGAEGDCRRAQGAQRAGPLLHLAVPGQHVHH